MNLISVPGAEMHNCKDHMQSWPDSQQFSLLILQDVKQQKGTCLWNQLFTVLFQPELSK